MSQTLVKRKRLYPILKSIAVLVSFFCDITHRTQSPPFTTPDMLFTKDGNGVATALFRQVKLALIGIHDTLISKHPGLTCAKPKRIEQTKSLFKIRQSLTVASQSLIDDPHVSQGRSNAFIAVKVMKTG